MQLARLKLIERIKRTPSIESFRFLPPGKINFLPGQFLQLIFDENNPDNKTLNKYLSISCSPYRDYIEVTKRISASEFSRSLQGLKKDDELTAKLPMGECIFKDEYKRIGFLIGGIGITPVISIIEYIIDKKLDTNVHLSYSNRTEEEIAFKPELDKWQSTNKNIKIIYAVSDCQPKDNKCIYGFIDKKLLMQEACDLSKRIVFIFGPPGMVDSMCTLSLELQCDRQNIRTERFMGY